MNNNWLILILLVFIVGIVLDGLVRARKRSRGKVKLSRNARKADLALAREAELMQSLTNSSPADSRDDDSESPSRIVRRSRHEPQQEALNFNEAVPMLMESVQDADERASEEEEPTDAYEERLLDNSLDDFSSMDTNDDDFEPALGAIDDLDAETDNSVSKVANQTVERDSPYQGFQFSKTKSHKQEKSESSAEPEPIEELVIFNVMSKSGERFQGDILKMAFLDAGLKYGKRQIFHRHKNNDGDADIVFSVANMIEPGSFHLAEMDASETPGVTLFLTLPCAIDSIAAYDDLAATAHRLVSALNGDLRDENRNMLTRQTLEHCRQKVVEYERRRKLPRQ